MDGRCFRAVTLPHSQTQTPNFTAKQSRCGSRLQDGEDVPNGATLRRGAAVRDTCAELFDSVDCIIGTMGRKKNEGGLPPRRARSGQRGKRSREYDRSTKSDRHLDKRLPLYDRRSFATMWNCTATVTLSDLPITTTGKVSQKGSSEIFILHNKSLFLQKENLSPQEKTHLRNKKSHICGSIWGINLGNAAYIFVYQLVTMLQPISTGLSPGSQTGGGSMSLSRSTSSLSVRFPKSLPTSALTTLRTAIRRWSITTMLPLSAQTMPSTNRTSVGWSSTSLNATAGLSRRSISAIPCGTMRNIFSSTKALPASNALCLSSTARITTT